jgi:hypothetical protein
MPALSKYSWVTSYEDADEALGDKSSLKIGNNTYLQRRGENIAVQLHNTDVIEYEPDGHIILDSGDYRSSTTKDRMNRYTPGSINVFQEDYEWFVEDSNETREFVDGIVVEPEQGEY